jgi:hypothetical protein
MTRREREKEGGRMDRCSIAVGWDHYLSEWYCNVGFVEKVAGRWNVVRTSKTGFNTEAEASAWAEAQKPRVEAAWAALTGGED